MSSAQNKRKTFSEAAAALLHPGSVGVLPTDTVYGLVARAHDREAVQRLYALKHRERKPGTIIAATLEQLTDLGGPLADLKIANRWWPNSLSVVVPLAGACHYIHQGLDSAPMRIPGDEALRAFLLETGPLVTSSANHPGKPESTNLDEAWNYFGHEVDFYVDGGSRVGCKPSTIIRIQDGEPVILRQGAVELS